MNLSMRLMAAALVVSTLAAGGKDVSAWEDTITIPTYRMGPEDINPRFFDLEGAIYYPYTEQEHLTTIKEDKDYKALYLENEYLKLVCLPELGGKIYSVLDKTTGKEMFYKNHVIKPGLIAMRGAWISGGIEWNAGPTGHGVTSYSPVDATYVKNRDGSATLVIGDTEHSTRTRWTVWLTLHPKRAYLDERIRIENPTDSVQTFYFWNNTAFPCNEYTRFIYPMTLGSDHNGTEFFSWPVHKGKDLTWLKNYDRPTSVFAYQCAFDFFGAYDVNEDQGIVQVANHHELVGKKAWTWGNSDDGLVSQSRLTDDDGPYIEVQSGPLETQADFGLLGPQESIEWQEWWYPVHGLGQGYEYATRDVAVETIWTKTGETNALELRLLTTGDFRDVRCTVIPEGGATNHGLDTTRSVTSNVNPETPLIHTFELGFSESATIVVESKEGRVLASFQSPLPIPELTPPDAPDAPKAETAEAHVLAGIEAEKTNNRNRAREAYEAALNLDSGNSDAHLGLAILDMESANYESARQHLATVLSRNPERGEAWYYLGVAWLGEERLHGGDPDYLDEALKAAHWAAQDLDTAALGHDLLGRVYMRMGRHADALRSFDASLARAYSPVVRQHRMIACYAAGDTDAAIEDAQELLARDPLCIVPHAVLAAAGEQDWTQTANVLLAQSGEDVFAILEAAYFAVDVGAITLAQRLLEATVQREPLLQSPMAHMLLAYLLHQSGNSSLADSKLTTAAALSPDYVFPSRPESLPVLRFAIDRMPEAGVFHLYLGNLYAGFGRLDEAVAAWHQAIEKNESLSVAHRNLGMHAWKKENDLAKAAAHFERALAARPSDQILYRDYARVLIAQEKRPDAIALLERSPEEPSRRGDLTTLLAQAYLDEQNYDATLALLNGKSFSNWEGNATTWNIYHRAHLARGKQRLEAGDAANALADFEASLAYPDNLGVGRPADPEEAESYYWKGRALAALNRTDDARKAYETSAQAREGSAAQNEHRNLAAEALADLK